MKAKPGRTRRAAAKRFIVTGSGRIKRKKAYHSHILTKKTPKQKRRLDEVVEVDPSNERAVRRMLPGI